MESMFDDWPVRFPPPARRVVDPPAPIDVDLARAFARTPTSGRGGVPMRVRAEGLDIGGVRPGLLHAWARTTAGDWLALVEFSVSTGNGNGRLDVRQWCPAGAVTRR